ncbi:CocE/NonD family hydrolase C-terminal non-catalytic domain-containing protein [Nocardia sp. CA-119907]|uniref:CocE/NonD family hydrolase C-terminal non-catalytic domain-containing protein n=1 Tax=Nocardia sp. CA-119907 TaxID=3239973 RepID=UPI003D9583B0
MPRDRLELPVPPGVSTVCSRDAAQGSAGIFSPLDVCAKDSRVAEGNALTFTSRAMTEPTAIFGPINVHLNAIRDATDGYWSVTVNDVAPDGTSTVLSTGQLPASIRAVDEARVCARRAAITPHRSIRSPWTACCPSSRETRSRWILRSSRPRPRWHPEHRLRVDVFTANPPKALAFRPMLNATEFKTQYLRFDPDTPSFINLPTNRPIG